MRRLLCDWGTTVLRIAVGWHFLYEGLWKVAVEDGWSAVEYLRSSRWIAAPLFGWIAGNPTVMSVCDFAVEWTLVAVGAALVLGVATRWAAAVGIALLAAFYVAHPPFLEFGGQSHYLLVNDQVLEALALLVVWAFPGAGVGALLRALRARLRGGDVASPERRELLAGLGSVGALAAFGGAFLLRHGGERPVEAVTSATTIRLDVPTLKDLTRKFDARGRIGGVEFSRIILGNNLISGYAHARDLQYVNSLMKAYNTRERIYRTLALGESVGFDTMLVSPSVIDFAVDYRRDCRGRLKLISNSGHPDGLLAGARVSVEKGCSAVYAHGENVDKYAAAGDWRTLREYLDGARKLGVPVGIGCHHFESLKFCVDHDLLPDFWMKTFHPVTYWSASHPKANDSIWCPDPEALAAYMEDRPEPWIAFKTMAAGAVHPREALPFVFNGGADFACMGMFDFQVVEDANLATAAFDRGFPDRRRPWRG